MERERENSEKMATGAAKLFGLSELPHKKKKEQLDIKTKHQTSVTNLQKKKKTQKTKQTNKENPKIFSQISKYEVWRQTTCMLVASVQEEERKTMIWDNLRRAAIKGCLLSPVPHKDKRPVL